MTEQNDPINQPAPAVGAGDIPKNDEPTFRPLRMVNEGKLGKAAEADAGASVSTNDPTATGSAPHRTAVPSGSALNSKKSKTRRRVIIAIIIAIILIILLLLLSQCGRCSTTSLAPSQDVAAQDMEQPEEKMEADEGGGAVNITYSGAAQIDLVSRTASIHVENPARSTHDMVIELVITDGEQETPVAKSGLLPAGYQLSTLDLNDNIEMEPGSYQGYFLISFYDPESKEQAYANTKMNLDSITVS